MLKNSAKVIKYSLIFVGLVIFFIFVKTLKIEEVKLAISNISYSSLLMVFLLSLVIIFIKAVRWKHLVKKITGITISTNFAFGSVLAGLAAGTLTPGRGGEIAKPLIIKATHGVPLSKSISAVFIEKMLELSATLLLAITSVILLGGTILGDYIGIYIFGASILLFIILIVKYSLFMKKIILIIFHKVIFVTSIKDKAIKLTGVFFESLAILKKKKVAFLFVGISLFSDILEVFKLYYVFRILGINVSFIQVLFILEASILFSLAMMIPGGIGVTEFAQVSIFSALGIAGVQLSKIAVLIDRLFSYYLLIIFGILVLIFHDVFYKKEIRGKVT